MKKKKILKLSAISFVAILLLIQFIQPNKENPPVEKEQTIDALLQVPDSVLTVFKRSCYDCHSNETKWPLYASIAPVSWLISHDVTEGRRELNFSEWGKYKAKRQLKKLSEIADEIEGNSMPMPIYLPLHPDAKLSDSDRRLIVAWSRSEHDKMADTSDVK
ncbi:MAG: heme-binding domain-containing protein [Bacteroidetes bacterium]|nr:heme-binding domain-containing protein [Bacteroidota bacterium]